MTDIVPIRPYEPRDRKRVRTICCDTADAGQPVESFFRDREFIADVVTGYYTDVAPQFSWVAEREGQVVAYLTGCVDTRQFWRAMWFAGLRAFLKATGRGTLAHRETWRFLCSLWKTWCAGGHRRCVPLDKYPGHVHVNVSDACRGEGVGPALMQRFMEQAKQAGCRGLIAQVRGDNLAGRAFFERQGFRVFSEHPLVVPRPDGFLKTSTVIYAIEL